MKKIIDIEHINKVAKNQKLEILSTYCGASKSLLYRCLLCKYEGNTSFSNIQNGSGCKRCAGNLAFTIEYVKKFCNNLNIEYLNDNYYNKDYRVDCKCLKCNYIWNTSFRHIQKSKGCPKCYGNVKLSLVEVIDIFKNRKIEYLSKDYVNSKTKSLCKCMVCGLEWMISVNQLSRQNGCPKCAGKLKHTIEEVKNYCIKNNIECISNVYKNSNTKLECRCLKCNHIFYPNFGNLKNGSRCSNCNVNGKQKFLQSFIEEIFNKEFKTIRPDWLKNTKTNYNLEIDLYNKDLKLAIEYHGEQHFKKVYFGNMSENTAKKVLKRRKYLDKLKIKLINKSKDYVDYFIVFTYKDVINKNNIIKRLREYGVNI